MTLEARLQEAVHDPAVDVATDRAKVVSRGRRRRARRRIVGGLGAGALVVALLGMAATLLTGDDEPTKVETVEEPPFEEESRGLLGPFIYEYETRPLPGAPLAAREGAVSVWTGEEWIVWGGVAATPLGVEGPTDPESSPTLDDGAVFEPTEQVWRPIGAAPLRPPNYDDVSAVAADGRMFVGWVDPAGALMAQSYDPSSDTWTVVADGPMGRGPWADMELVGVDDRVVLAAVEASESGAPVQLFTTDAAGAEWSALGDEVAIEAQQIAATRSDESVMLLGTHLVASPSDDGSRVTSSQLVKVDPTDGTAEVGGASLDLPGWDGRLFAVGDRLVLWGGRSAPCAPDPEDCPVEARASVGATTGGVDEPWVPMEGDAPWDEAGQAAVVVEDAGLLSVSGWFSGGVGDPADPPAYGPGGPAALYDASANRWIPLMTHDDDGDPIGGPVLQYGDATAWTGDELLVLSGGRSVRAERSNANAYGPHRSTVEDCEPAGPGEDRPAPWPYWQPATAPSIEALDPAVLAESNAGWTNVFDPREPAGPALAFAPPSYPPRGRPGTAMEIVDRDCDVIGYYAESFGPLTVEQYETLDFSWYADSPAVAPPRAGAVVRQLTAEYLSTWVVADPDVERFRPARQPIPEQPRWSPDSTSGDSLSEASDGGLVRGAAVGRWADFADLEPDAVVMMETNNDWGRFDVEEVEVFGADEPVRRRGDYDLELRIESDDATTVVYLNHVEEDDRRRRPGPGGQD